MTWRNADKAQAKRLRKRVSLHLIDKAGNPAAEISGAIRPVGATDWYDYDKSRHAYAKRDYTKGEEQLTAFENNVRTLGRWCDKWDANRRGWGASTIIARHDVVNEKVPRAMWTLSEAMGATDSEILGMFALDIEGIVRLLYGPTSLPSAEMEAVGMGQRDPDMGTPFVAAKRSVVELANARYEAEITSAVRKAKGAVEDREIREVFMKSNLGLTLEAITLDPAAAGASPDAYAIRLTKRLLRDDLRTLDKRRLQAMLQVTEGLS